MDEDDNHDEDADAPNYIPVADIDPSALRSTLCKLRFLGDDPFLRMQAVNISVVDIFLSRLEDTVLKKLFADDSAPLDEAAFLSAQSQMWIFATYELLRTWRQRTAELIKWHKNGGLDQKLKTLEKDLGYRHFGRSYRAEQIRKVRDDPSLVEAMHNDRRRIHILFVQIEALRVSLAKHELRGKRSSVALMPGYGRINRWCGSLDYELENGLYSMGTINRRNIADGIRALFLDDDLPSDADIESFEAFMRGPDDLQAF